MNLPTYTPPPLCLLCSSSILPSPSTSAQKTRCCSRFICKLCTDTKGRIARWDPCLHCEGGWGTTRTTSTLPSDNVDSHFTLGDEDEENEDGKGELTAETEDAPTQPQIEALCEDDPKELGQLTRHIIQKGETLIGISLKYGIDASLVIISLVSPRNAYRITFNSYQPHQLCLLNKLPPSTIHTTPHLLHTRTYLLLLPSPPPPLPASTRIQLAHERALARFAKITKEEDPLVRSAYVGIAEIDKEFGISSGLDDHPEQEKKKADVETGEQATVEGRAVGRFFEDEEWEARRQEGVRGFPVGGGKWKAAGAQTSSERKVVQGPGQSWWSSWGQKVESPIEVKSG